MRLNSFQPILPALAVLALILGLNATCDSSVQELSEDGGIRFLVDEVEIATEKLNEAPMATVLLDYTPPGMKESRMLAYSLPSTGKRELVHDYIRLPATADVSLSTAQGFKLNNLIQAVHFAHSEHRPLQLSPDAVWITLLQGFVLHQRVRSEPVLKKKRLEAFSFQDFDPLDPKANWDLVLEKVSSELIEAESGEDLHLLLPEFSTTGKTERMVMRASLLMAFQDRYEYEYGAICGIPHITLTGTVEDWKLLRERAAQLGRYDLEWWTEPLLPILDQFIKARSGQPDRAFWKSIYKKEGEYVAQGLNGWILKLYPYIRNPAKTTVYDVDGTAQVEFSKTAFSRNPFLGEHPCGKKESSLPCFLELERIPADTGSFPLRIRRQATRQIYDVDFFAGIYGISQLEDLTLTPEPGWYVEMK
ncbi:MAG: DUF4419 domain-containing protein [Leptospiraceae bacterium]|nr:DUF4419 domain-containing protein [Leptospiraceae bacterium]